MTWFNELFGLAEPKLLSAVHSNFVLSPKHDCIMSLANGRVYQVGSFSTPTVADLRERALQMLSLRAYRRVSLEVDHLLTGDILEWHHNHPFATFQAASQFNCLDFPQQTCTPEDGITHYASVRSQGQSCALACPGGALYRNYFLPVWDEDKQCFQSGQSADLQINNLALLEEALGNREMGYWNVRNGYINVESKDKLLELAERLSSPSAQRLFRDKVQLGWQEDVEVSFSRRFESLCPPRVVVSQVLCSAVSCSFSPFPNTVWQGRDVTHAIDLFSPLISYHVPGCSFRKARSTGSLRGHSLGWDIKHDAAREG
eukprot:gene7930-8749_t